MKGYRKILIAVNGSTEVLKTGLKVAKDEGCWVTVMKVIPPYEGELNLVGIKNIEDVLDGYAENFVGDAKDIARSERVLIKTRIETGDISSKILDVAEEEDCDLIIVGARKKKGIKRFFGDRVIDKLINNSPCPVLVIGSGSSGGEGVLQKVLDFLEAQ